MKTIFNNKLAALLFGVLLMSSSAFSQSNSGIPTGAAADKSFRSNSSVTNGGGNNTTQPSTQNIQTTARISGTTLPNATSVSTTSEVKPNSLTLMGRTYATQVDFDKVSALMEEKIKNGQSPPLVTDEDLRKLNIKPITTK